MIPGKLSAAARKEKPPSRLPRSIAGRPKPRNRNVVEGYRDHEAHEHAKSNSKAHSRQTTQYVNDDGGNTRPHPHQSCRPPATTLHPLPADPRYTSPPRRPRTSNPHRHCNRRNGRRMFMKDTKFINILQYNVRKDRVSTMIPLLADSNTQDYDVIAIQEPWRSTHASTTLSSHQSGFHLLYRPGGDTRVCFYVNEKIDPESWEVEFPTADLCTLKLNVSTDGVTRMLHIHSVYNPSPSSYSSTDSPSTLPAVRQQLAADAQHVLLGDFNLHNPFWDGVTRPTQHAAADQLLDIVEEFDLSLTLPKGTVTWEARNSFSTIDLVFMSEFLTERLEHCMSRPEMNQSSDHIPISTRILLGSEQLTKVKRRAWKLLNMEKLREAESNAPSVTHPRSAEEIDQYAQTIQEYLQKIIAASVPWARPSEYAKPFWNEECNRATRETRKLRHSWSSSRHLDDWKAYMKSNDKKQKIIQKQKRSHSAKRLAQPPSRRWAYGSWQDGQKIKARSPARYRKCRH